jgi:hypothetical protein
MASWMIASVALLGLHTWRDVIGVSEPATG